MKKKKSLGEGICCLLRFTSPFFNGTEVSQFASPERTTPTIKMGTWDLQEAGRSAGGVALLPFASVSVRVVHLGRSTHHATSGQGD